MTSRALGHAYTPPGGGNPGRVVVTVRHLDTDSYTRSVDRAAMRRASQLAGGCYYPGNAWSLTDGRYAVGSSPDDGRGNGRPYCLSEITFTLTPMTGGAR